MKKLGRAIRRLFIAGVVAAGALFAAVKVGPRVASKVGPLLHRAPPEEHPGTGSADTVVEPEQAGPGSASE